MRHICRFNLGIVADFYLRRNRGGDGILVPGYATLAQLVEHLIRNEEVAGSIPAGGSIQYVSTIFGRNILDTTAPPRVNRVFCEAKAVH